MSAIRDVAAAILATDAGLPLRSRYGEPWRRYHDWSHIEAMLGHLHRAESEGVPVADPVAAVGCVLWHDAVYDPQASSGRNETLSAALCRAEFVAEERSVTCAAAAILATIDHRVPDRGYGDVALILDIDLSVLGADPATFGRYDAGIAREYSHVPTDAYRTGRAAILRRFLGRDPLFLTEWARQQWEATARANLAGALTLLDT